jgi:hypothetical protein
MGDDKLPHKNSLLEDVRKFKSDVQVAYTEYLILQQNTPPIQFLSQFIGIPLLIAGFILMIFTSPPTDCDEDAGGDWVFNLDTWCIFPVTEIIFLSFFAISGFCFLLWMISNATNEFEKDRLLLNLAKISNFPSSSAKLIDGREERILKHVQSILFEEE